MKNELESGYRKALRIRKRTYPFWIKERINPQLGTYYVTCGRLSRAAAKRQESSLYGENIMHEYPDEQSYLKKIAEMKSRGVVFQ